MSVSNAAGTALAVNTYDEYGIPGPNNLGRFQYTGQSWIASLGMYDYKARMYSPTLGRFMQTDPIGYGDGPNWYNYVGSDPVNFVDPTGLKCQPPSGPPAEPDEIVVVAKCDDGEGGGGPKEYPIPTPPQVPGFGSTDAPIPTVEPPECNSALPPAPDRVRSAPRTIKEGVRRTKAGLKRNVLSGALRGLHHGLSGFIQGAGNGYAQSVIDAYQQTKPGGTCATNQGLGNVQYGAVLSSLYIPQFLQLMVGDADEAAETLNLKKPNDPVNLPWDTPEAKSQIKQGGVCAASR